ncbi:MAG: hypothetical protein Q8S24_00680 [Eubacteriales bacterium]|nr:hypothetical protein [Eubacteriales bacterium]
MNKKRFAIFMVIAIILSSYTLAFANNSDGNKEKKDNTANKKIHVHLQSGKEDISQVFVEIDGVETELFSNGNSGKYTVPKGTDLVSETLTMIRIVYTSELVEFYTPAQDSQQGQEGQGSINYRINIAGSNENEEEATDGTGDTDGGISDGGTSDGGTDGGTSDGGTNGGTSDGGENIAGGGDTPSDSTTENDETFITIELTIDETPLGTPELESQEIASIEETPVEIEIVTLDLEVEDEETPLDIPSTGVATPFLYGAGALISLVGLLKRR